MAQATFTFHDDLNFFLARKHRNQSIPHRFDWKASIKDMIESLNVPHPEIDLLLVNGQSVDFEHIVQDGDEIDVYPMPYFQTHPLSDKQRLIPAYEGRARFILDTHLGRLASYLRLMGFDTLYRNDYPDDELAEVSNRENRILLTRDIGLLKRSLVIYGYYVRNTNPRQRLHEIVQRYQLAEHIQPFSFCMKCNGRLHEVDKKGVITLIGENTASHYEEFHQCDRCEQVYWKGSHYTKMARLIDEVIDGRGLTQ